MKERQEGRRAVHDGLSILDRPVHKGRVFGLFGGSFSDQIRSVLLFSVDPGPVNLDLAAMPQVVRSETLFLFRPMACRAGHVKCPR